MALLAIILATWVLPLAGGLLVLERLESQRLALGVRLVLAACIGHVGLLLFTLVGAGFIPAWGWPVLGAALGGQVIARMLRNQRPAASAAGKWQGLAMGVLVTSLLVRFGTQIVRPAFHSDELLIFGAKARALFFGRGLGAAFSDMAQATVNRPDYPILSSILQWHVMLQTSAHEFFLVRVPFLGVQLLLLMGCVGFGRMLGKTWLGLAAGLFVISNALVSAPGRGVDQAFFCMGDSLVALGFLAVVMVMCLGDRLSERTWAVAMTAGLGVMVASKNEGLMLCACCALVLIGAALFNPKRSVAGLWTAGRVLILPALLVLGNFTLIDGQGAGMNVVGSGGELGASQFGEAFAVLRGRGVFVVGYFLREILFDRDALGILVLLPLVMLAVTRRPNPWAGLGRALWVLGLCGAGYVFFFAINGTGVFTPESTNTWQMDHAFLRVFLQIAPGSLVLLLSMLQRLEVGHDTGIGRQED